MSSRSWFPALLLPWYRSAHRPLPWRETRDPYRIWLSEVILQQTRVDQGLPYYLRFTAKWPTVKKLAAADEQDVLKAWQGLGYYSRARNLLAAARQVVQDHGGHFPATHAGLLGLKGVGDYTASAIASICFGKPEAVVDGNVYRVLARAFGLDVPIDSTAGRQAFKELATELLDRDAPGDHNQAVMELGATICTPQRPDCPHCPLQPRCVALATGTVQQLPVKVGKTKSRDRYFNYLHIAHGKGLYMRRRKEKDIWQGLHELPLLESAKSLTRRALATALNRVYGPGWKVLADEMEQRHVLSHQVIHAVFRKVAPPKDFAPPADWIAVSRSGMKKLAVPRLIERWLKRER
jgi:A/G-specific adenine glycosylase